MNLKNGLHFLVCIFWCAFQLSYSYLRLHGNCTSAILLYVSDSGNEGTSDHAELGTPIRYQQLGSTCTDCTQSCLNALHRYTAVSHNLHA